MTIDQQGGGWVERSMKMNVQHRMKKQAGKQGAKSESRERRTEKQITNDQ
jgi:hypothetical protein